MPVPANGIISVVLSALEITETLPTALPAETGANVALKVTLWFGLRVSGEFRPATVNPVPAAVACERVTLEPPVLVTAAERLCALPTLTLPKLRLPGLATS